MNRTVAVVCFLVALATGVVLAPPWESEAGTPGTYASVWGVPGTIRDSSLGAGDQVQLIESEIRAAKRGRRLWLTLPVTNDTTRHQKVSCLIALTDLEGNRLSRIRNEDWVAPGSSELDVRLPGFKPKGSIDQEIRYVLSYTVRAGRRDYEGRKSLFYLLPKPTLAGAVPERLFAGSKSQIPLVLTDAVTRTPYAGELVSVTATTEDGKTHTATATTDSSGAALVVLPELAKGPITLSAKGRVQGASPTELESSAEVVEDTKVFLSTDKPLYQPGQTMYVRALVLAKPDMKPAAGDDTLLEIFDSKGNKVFKQVARTNEFGVASAEFTLANQVNKGSYNIMLTAGDSQLEKAVTVDRYVLPKFKVNVQLDRDFYQPSDELEGTVQAAYFFGKPVSKGKVTITIFDYQAQWVPDRVIQGTANEEGILHFSHKLPSRLVGQPVAGGNALMLMEVEVEDGGGQLQKQARQIVVARSPVEVAVFPESGAVVAGVENGFFIALTDPAGHPVAGSCKLSFSSSGTRSKTIQAVVDRTGLTRVSYTPADGVTGVQLKAEAEAETGDKVDKQFQFQLQQADARILLRPTRTLLKAGESLVVDVVAAGAVSDAYLDVTKESQTVALETVRLEDGFGRFRLDLDPSMAGTLAISAYVLSERGEFTRDTRVVYVEAASDLDIKVSLDKKSYLPGGKASVDFKVSGKNGSGVQAALGIQVVDEAVFALSESKPGLLKLFFALEEELLKPTYQIGRGIGLTLGSLIIHARDAKGDDDQRIQANAEAAIAAQGDVAVARRSATSWVGERVKARAHLDQYGVWLKQEFASVAKEDRKCTRDGWWQFEDEVKHALEEIERDAWGLSFSVESSGQSVTLVSAGPDMRFDSWDDVQAVVTPWEACPQTIDRRKFRRGWGRGDRWAEQAVPMAAMAGGEAGADFDMMPEEPKMEEPEKRPAEKTKGESAGDDEGGGGGEEVRVRTWFPETLFVENCLVTDANGHASLDIPLADSITTWRMSTVASDLSGRIGGVTNGVTVFQDFFVDIDFPVFLTRNDTIEFPVVVYNYLEEEQNVDIEVKGGDWFELMGDAEASLKLGPGQVKSVRFPVRVKRVGWHALTVYGRGSAGFADAVQRTVQVRPDGQEVLAVTGGKFSASPGDGAGDRVELDYQYSQETVEGSQQLVVQVLPGLSSHVVQGMESMLKLPGG